MKTFFKWTALIVAYVAMTCFAYAGKTYFTTSDSAPLYPTSGAAKNTKVIIKNTETVKLDTESDDGGNIWVEYELSPGVSFVYNSGGGEPFQIAIFAFDASTKGKVNTIKITSISHTSSATGDECNGGNKGAITYTVCIPAISVPIKDPIQNYFYGFEFHTYQTISGCDDFSQLEFQQTLSVATSYLAYDGTSVEPTDTFSNTNGNFIIDGATGSAGNMDWAAVDGTVGMPFDISGTTAVFKYADTHYRFHTRGQVIIGGDNYTYINKEMTKTSQFKTKIRRTDGHAVIDEYDWGYTWDNKNTPWTNTTTPPLSAFPTPAPPALAPSKASFGGLYPGITSTGTPYTGQFSNVTGITLPTTHYP